MFVSMRGYPCNSRQLWMGDRIVDKSFIQDYNKTTERCLHMRLNFHAHYRPAHDVVFSILFGKRDLFCALVSAVTGEIVELEDDPHSQATLREDDVLLLI